jgi:hypothetical protein
MYSMRSASCTPRIFKMADLRPKKVCQENNFSGEETRPQMSDASFAVLWQIEKRSTEVIVHMSG